MPAELTRVLDAVKVGCNLIFDDPAFDFQILMATNAAFGTLQQLGVGPSTGFSITDRNTLWSGYTSRQDLLGMVQEFIVLTVKLDFDPPQSGYGISQIEKRLAELVFRINIAAESLVTNLSGWWDLTGLSDFPPGAQPGDYGFDSSDGSIYVNGDPTHPAEWWDLTGLTDFPEGAVVGDYGYDSSTWDVWRCV